MNKIITVLLLVLTMVFAGCEMQNYVNENQKKATESTFSDISSQDLIKFENFSEVEEFLMEKSIAQSNQRSFGGMASKALTTGAAAPMMDMAESFVSDGGANDYSTTNTQYENVDEADFIKNDGQYIYIIADNKLVIVDAYDAENVKILSETNLGKVSDRYYENQRAKEIFINGDKLVVFVEVNKKTYSFSQYDIMPRETYRQNTVVKIYDVGDRKKPNLVEEYEVSGNYDQSRMIGDKIYLVSKENSMTGGYPIRPMIDGSTKIINPEIYYFDNPDSEYYYNTVTSFDLSSNEVLDSKTFMLGYSNTLMVSENNIYISYQKRDRWFRPWYHGNQYEKERFFDVVVPLLTGELKTDIETVLNQDFDDDTKQWKAIESELSKFFSELEDDEDKQDEYEDMFEKIYEALNEYDMKKELEDKKTIIHKIGISDGKISYLVKGEVDGDLLNQFSMDESDGNLRVATTVTLWTNKRVQYNNVYVLDNDMNIIGELTGIGEDEKIYSTRFLGNKLYMVTFKQIDPFFVIDLSDNDPKILGELKIPGYSDYLHPYDENHIIGVGKQVDQNEHGGLSTKGVKIALFDVSDYNEPKLVDEVEIGESGTDSPVLNDHKAFLFDRNKNLLVIPVREVIEKNQKMPYGFNYKIWDGAYVFNLDKEGFREIGTVEHDRINVDYYRWFDEATVLRSLYMDDNLYTVSNKYIKINDLSNDLEELGMIELPYSENGIRYY